MNKSQLSYRHTSLDDRQNEINTKEIMMPSFFSKFNYFTLHRLKLLICEMA